MNEPYKIYCIVCQAPATGTYEGRPCCWECYTGSRLKAFLVAEAKGAPAPQERPFDARVASTPLSEVFDCARLGITNQEVAEYIAGFATGTFEGPKESNEATILNALSTINCRHDGIVSWLIRRESNRWVALYHELLSAVEKTHTGETQHEAALRCIREAGSGAQNT